MPNGTCHMICLYEQQAFAAYTHKVAYGFGRIQGPKFRRLGSVDDCAYMFKGLINTMR